MKSKETWQQRAAEHRKSAVLEVYKRDPKESALCAIRRVACKYNGCSLPERKHLKLSVSTLRRLYYAWKKEPSDAVFGFCFIATSKPTVVQPWVSCLFAEYAIQRGLTVPQAYQTFKSEYPELPFSFSVLQRNLCPVDRARIKKAITLRKKQVDLNKELETLTNKHRRVS